MPLERPNHLKKKATRRFKLIQLLRFAELLRPARFLLWLHPLESAPQRPDGIDPVTAALQKMANDIPFLPKEFVSSLVKEVPQYKRYASEVSGTRFKARDIIQTFWDVRESESTLKFWVKALKMIALIPSSSADVERVVSVFTDVINDNQKQVMEATVEARVIVRYNNRKPKKRNMRRFYTDGSLSSGDDDEEEDEDDEESSILSSSDDSDD
jgi:hypothetical protein